MKTFFLAILSFCMLFLFACKEKETPKQTATTAKPEPEIVSKPEVKPTEPQPVVKETPHYFLIAGCFEYKENANKLCTRLQKEGYPEAQVLAYYENLYLVAYEGYAHKNDAIAALKFMQNSSDKKGTWLHYQK